MHNHYIQLFESYVFKTPLRYKALAKTLIIKYRYMLIKNKGISEAVGHVHQHKSSLLLLVESLQVLLNP